MLPTQVIKENIVSNVALSSNNQVTEIVEPQSTKVKRLYIGDIVTWKRALKPDENPSLGTVVPGSSETELNRSKDGGSSSEVWVHWDSANKLGMTKVKEISLVDRMLTRGQRVKTEDGLGGTVINFNNKAALNIVGTSHIVENVALDRLRPISAFVRGQEILYLDWVGIITNIKRNVWFRMDGGKTFYIETNESDGFMKNDPYWGIGVSCPGVRTNFSPVILKQAKWPGATMRFLWKWVPLLPFWYSSSSALITRSEVIQLTVKWLHIAPYKIALVPPLMPPDILEQHQLRFVELIGTPSTETIGFNSVRIFKLKPDDTMTSQAMWLGKFRKQFMETPEGPGKIVNYTPPFSLQQNDNGYDLPAKVVLRQNEVEIEWDDESKSIMLSADVPYISRVVEDPEYPSGLVVAPVHKNVANAEQYGVVQISETFVVAKKRTVFVRWIHIDSQRNVSDFGIHEESVYDIKPHPRYSLYIRSTIVFAKIPVREKFRAGTVIDIDVRAGKMIVLNPSDNTTHYVYPHVVTPMAKRCFWNFFYKNWEEDALIPPVHQLELENDPEKNIADATGEIQLDSLFTDNNNMKLAILEEPSIWDHPLFEMLPEAPTNHRFYEFNKEIYTTGFSHNFAQEHTILKDHMPEGIWIRLFENRMDLLSVCLLGPKKTPYEDGLILFDMQLPANFPLSRPKVKYISYVTTDINPLLSNDGNFCISCTKWEPVLLPNEENTSNILSFVLQIQSLIFSAEPLYSGKIYDNSKIEDSVTYNERVFISVLDSAFNMMHKPWAPWEQLIRSHFTANLPDRLKFGKAILGKTEEDLLLRQEVGDFGFPLAPTSAGFEIALSSRLSKIEQYMEALRSEPNDTIVSEEKSSISSRHLDFIEEECSVGPVSNTNVSIVDEVFKQSSRDTMKNFLSKMTTPEPERMNCNNEENIPIPLTTLPENSAAE